jgi:transposase
MPVQMALPFAEKRGPEKTTPNASTPNALNIPGARPPVAKHPGRDHLPEDLPIEEVHVDPPGDLSELVRIGELITNKLEIVPAKAYIKTLHPWQVCSKGQSGCRRTDR